MSSPTATRRRLLSRADLRSARMVEANGSTAASGSQFVMPSCQQSVFGSSRLVCQDSINCSVANGPSGWLPSPRMYQAEDAVFMAT